VWRRSKWTGRTGELLGALSREDVSPVEGRRGGLAHVVALSLANGDALALEVFRGDDVEHFAAAYG